MSEKRIIFIPYKLHLRHLLFAIAEKTPVTVMLPPEKSLPPVTKLAGIRIKYSEFGADILKPYIGSEIRTLKYVRGLAKLFDAQNFNTLVTFEFYHWYTLQCLAYKKKNPDLKLFLVSETKRWPRNIVARIFKRVLLWYFRRNIKYFEHVFVYTDTAKEFLAEHVPEADVTLLPAPIDTELFKPSPGKQFCADGHLRLLINARYSPYKRHEDLFAAISELRKKGRQVSLTCISRDNKGKESIVEMAERMGVSDMVNFIDALPQSDMPALYYAHDVLVLPSYNEAIGMVVPEAMSCGIPTITSDTVGANVYVTAGETGFIFKTGDVEALVTTLDTCFDNQMLETMGNKARQYIINELTPSAIADKFLKVIEK